jgi:hypothetical protein
MRKNDSITINLIDIEKYQDGEFYVIDLYENRKFESEVNIFLWAKECWGNLEYLWYFKNCDEKNIKITVYCSYVLFPIASLIGHKIILYETDILNMFEAPQKSFFVHKFKNGWNAKTFNNAKFSSSNARFDLPLPKHMIDIQNLHDIFINKPIYLDTVGYNNFINNVQSSFFENYTYIEIKTFAKTLSHILSNTPNVIGVDKKFQIEIIKKYNGTKYFLTYQLLSSIYKGCSYMGIDSGSASLMSLALPLNCLFICDTDFNVSSHMYLLKSIYNLAKYNIHTKTIIYDRFFRLYGQDTRIESQFNIDFILNCLKLKDTLILPKIIINNI